VHHTHPMVLESPSWKCLVDLGSVTHEKESRDIGIRERLDGTLDNNTTPVVATHDIHRNAHIDERDVTD
jgi:hypothetical protein